MVNCTIHFLYKVKQGAADLPRPAFRGHAERAPLPDGLHLGELLEESVVLLEAFLGALEHLHRLVGADLLDELLEMRRRSFASKGRLRSDGEAARKGLRGSRQAPSKRRSLDSAILSPMEDTHSA